MSKRVRFEELVGKTIVKMVGWLDAEKVAFVCSDGSEYCLYHEQDCCEHVWLEEASGCDKEDIIGSPILLAEEVAGESGADDDGEHYTWTFYKLSTIKGSLTLRWLGESNGYYSEEVSFERLDKEDESNTLHGCPACSGTGEGSADGASCRQCRGRGWIDNRPKEED